jgi:drug/metabolite transporter (DMT)-like permease
VPVPRSTYLFLAVGLIAASQSGNLIRIGNAPAVVMAAWRLALASLLLAPMAGKGLRSLRELSRGEWALVAAAGVALGAHLVAWIAAVQLTTVANAAFFFSVNPVMIATAAHVLYKEQIRSRIVLAISFGLAGVLLMGWHDLDLNQRHIAGDTVALLSAAFFAGYFLVGKRLRRTLDTRVYVCVLYATAAAGCFACVAVMGLPAIVYDRRTWTCFVLLAIVPTLIGHTSLNHALRYLGAGWISCATLSEAPLAGLVAAIAWEERPSLSTLVGYFVTSLSVVVLVVDRGRASPAPPVPGTAER